MNFMPDVVSSKNIQTSYAQIFSQAKKTDRPIIVLKNNKPDVAIVSMTLLEEMNKKIQEIEMKDALDSIRVYKREKKAGKLLTGFSLYDLIHNERKKS